jgi:hypothetical protein
MRLRYFEQLPTVAAMLVPERKYNPQDVAAEAIALVEGVLYMLQESYEWTFTEVSKRGGEAYRINGKTHKRAPPERLLRVWDDNNAVMLIFPVEVSKNE